MLPALASTGRPPAKCFLARCSWPSDPSAKRACGEGFMGGKCDGRISEPNECFRARSVPPRRSWGPLLLMCYRSQEQGPSESAWSASQCCARNVRRSASQSSEPNECFLPSLASTGRPPRRRTSGRKLAEGVRGERSPPPGHPKVRGAGVPKGGRIPVALREKEVPPYPLCGDNPPKGEPSLYVGGSTSSG